MLLRLFSVSPRIIALTTPSVGCWEGVYQIEACAPRTLVGRDTVDVHGVAYIRGYNCDCAFAKLNRRHVANYDLAIQLHSARLAERPLGSFSESSAVLTKR